MSGEKQGDATSTRSKRRAWWAAAAAVLLAGLTALAAGLGQKAADWITTTDSPLLSYGVEAQYMECGSATYLPDPRPML